MFETFKVFKSIKTWFLVPLVAFIASINCFLAVDLSKSYIACSYGIHWIGYWFGTWGISSSIFAILIGPISKRIKKTLIVLVVLTLSSLSMVYLLIWSSDSHIGILFGLAVLFGCFEAVWGTVINGIFFFFKEQK